MCAQKLTVERVLFFGDLSKMGVGEKDFSLKTDCLMNDKLLTTLLFAFLTYIHSMFELIIYLSNILGLLFRERTWASTWNRAGAN